MPVDEFHRDVAAIALRAAGTHGFALGGGNALIAHGIISRPTEDVDLRAAGVSNQGLSHGGGHAPAVTVSRRQEVRRVAYWSGV